MKAILAIALSILALNAFSASPKCPTGSTQILKCTEATQDDDNTLVVDFMNGALICRDLNGNYGIILTARNLPNSPIEAVTRTVLSGTTNYTFKEDPVTYTLSRLKVPGEINGRYSISMGRQNLHRSLTCN